jgi:predicted nucleic acid-binding protein
VPLDATLDMSFWINAYRAGLLSHVVRRFRLHCAPQVLAEFGQQFTSGRDFRRRMQMGEIGVVAPATLHLPEFNLGERAAISVAIEHPGWILLMDDYRPFLEATRRGLTAVSTPMLAVALYSEGMVDADETLTVLGRLAAIQTVSPHLIAASLATIGRASGYASGR